MYILNSQTNLGDFLIIIWIIIMDVKYKIGVIIIFCICFCFSLPFQGNANLCFHLIYADALKIYQQR